MDGWMDGWMDGGGREGAGRKKGAKNDLLFLFFVERLLATAEPQSHSFISSRMLQVEEL